MPFYINSNMNAAKQKLDITPRVDDKILTLQQPNRPIPCQGLLQNSAPARVIQLLGVFIFASIQIPKRFLEILLELLLSGSL